MLLIKNVLLFCSWLILVNDWSSLAEWEQIPLNDSMITFGMKLAIVTMFGDDFSEVIFFCPILQKRHFYTNTQKDIILNNLYRKEQNRS